MHVDSDSNPDSGRFGLDSDSELEIRLRIWIQEKTGFGFESGFMISGFAHTPHPYRLALLPPMASWIPDSKHLDSYSRKKGWIRI